MLFCRQPHIAIHLSIYRTGTRLNRPASSRLARLDTQNRIRRPAGVWAANHRPWLPGPPPAHCCIAPRRSTSLKPTAPQSSASSIAFRLGPLFLPLPSDSPRLSQTPPSRRFKHILHHSELLILRPNLSTTLQLPHYPRIALNERLTRTSNCLLTLLYPAFPQLQPPRTPSKA